MCGGADGGLSKNLLLCNESKRVRNIPFTNTCGKTTSHLEIIL